MQNDGIQKNTTKTIRLDTDLIRKIEELGKSSERDFSSQVRYMLKKFIEITEDK